MMIRISANARICMASMIAASILVSGCWRPVFDVGVSTGALIAGRLDAAGSIGPVDMGSEDYERGEFHPALGTEPTEGFFVSDGSDIRITYVYPDPVSGEYAMIETSTPKQGPYGIEAAAGPIRSNSDPGPPVINFEEPSVLISGAANGTANPWVALFFVVKTYTMGVFSGSTFGVTQYYEYDPRTNAQGFSSHRSGGVLTRRWSRLYFDDGIPATRHQFFDFFLTGLVFDQQQQTDLPFSPSAFPLFQDGYCGATVSSIDPSAVVTASGKDATYRNTLDAGNTMLDTNVSTVQLDHSITAVLTNGMMLSEDDGFLYVYEQDGGERFHTAIGKLRFAHEAWSSADNRWYMIFVLPLPEYRNGNVDVVFRIYSVPAVDIDRLK
ncbi:MAG: hypothetical protein NT080_14235 [Spirochaetes bacterium]|nr:hypothetical protein [Spirochaetota bacterium]